MNARFARFVATGLVVAASLPAALSAEPRRSASLVEIVVNGSSQPQYAHGGRRYVEALKGKEYAIRLHNPYPVRVAVALSVDGLNTIDARETTAAGARKWNASGATLMRRQPFASYNQAATLPPLMPKSGSQDK